MFTSLLHLVYTRVVDMDRGYLKVIQSQTINKFNDLISHMQCFGEEALPPMILRCNTGGAWDLLRDIFFELLPEDERSGIITEKFTQQAAYRNLHTKLNGKNIKK